MALWQDLHLLWEDMRRYARAYPQATFLCADRPPEVGWVAFWNDELGREVSADWTISVWNTRRHDLFIEAMNKFHADSDGLSFRTKMLDDMVAEARIPKIIPTLWDRLSEEES